jgi:hypothetical protein
MRSIVPIAGLAALALAGCGSSSESSSVSTSRATPTTTSSTSATQTTSTTTSSPSTTTQTTSTTTSSPSTTTKTTSTTSTRMKTKQRAAAAPGGPELPADFTIKAGGTLSPPSVSAPGRTPILLTISTKDGATHQVALGTPQSQRLTVQAGHPGRVLLEGLRDGTYAVEVDGHPRGKLIVGATPGP